MRETKKVQMKLSQNLILNLSKKGFNGDCVCCAQDWFREKHNIFIGHSWEIDSEANRVIWCFKIEYIWGYKEPYKKTQIEGQYDDNDLCQMESIEKALELI